MKIRKNDNVIVIAGKDKGKTGKVLEAFPALDMVLVEGINVKKRHQRGNRSNQKGQIVEKAHPVHVSNVMMVDPKTNKPTRVGFRTENGKKVRLSRKSDTVLS